MLSSDDIEEEEGYEQIPDSSTCVVEIPNDLDKNYFNKTEIQFASSGIETKKLEEEWVIIDERDEIEVMPEMIADTNVIPEHSDQQLFEIETVAEQKDTPHLQKSDLTSPLAIVEIGTGEIVDQKIKYVLEGRIEENCPLDNKIYETVEIPDFEEMTQSLNAINSAVIDASETTSQFILPVLTTDESDKGPVETVVPKTPVQPLSLLETSALKAIEGQGLTSAEGTRDEEEFLDEIAPEVEIKRVPKTDHSYEFIEFQGERNDKQNIDDEENVMNINIGVMQTRDKMSTKTAVLDSEKQTQDEMSTKSAVLDSEKTTECPQLNLENFTEFSFTADVSSSISSETLGKDIITDVSLEVLTNAGMSFNASFEITDIDESIRQPDVQTVSLSIENDLAVDSAILPEFDKEKSHYNQRKVQPQGTQLLEQRTHHDLVEGKPCLENQLNIVHEAREVSLCQIVH